MADAIAAILETEPLSTIVIEGRAFKPYLVLRYGEHNYYFEGGDKLVRIDEKLGSEFRSPIFEVIERSYLDLLRKYTDDDRVFQEMEKICAELVPPS
jgi:hypothetical protein